MAYLSYIREVTNEVGVLRLWYVVRLRQGTQLNRSCLSELLSALYPKKYHEYAEKMADRIITEFDEAQRSNVCVPRQSL
jgi:hypothetical protein